MTTLLVLALCAVVALLPLALVLRGGNMLRTRKDSALAIHRAQLTELDRDLAEGRIAPAEHASARLEVQRRLLAADDAPEGPPPRAARAPLLATLVLVPLVGAGLYALDGHPFLAAAPLAARIAAADKRGHDPALLITMLQERLAMLDPHSEMARRGFVLLGNAEDSLGRLPEAVDAWRHALDIRFEPELAAMVAEGQTRIDGGKVGPATAALFRRALAAAPANAPWRGLVEKRLTEAGG